MTTAGIENVVPSRLPQPEPLVLASTSPRRRELMQSMGYQFDTVAPPFEEIEERPGVDPVVHVESLAFFKASSIADSRIGATVLGADTIATINGDVIGKPADRDHARHILKTLSGTVHRVITGVAILCARDHRRLIGHDISIIRVRPLSERMIEDYLQTGLWQGKAGAYGIQDEGDPFVEAIEGSYSNVVGLPMELIGRWFREWERTASKR